LAEALLLHVAPVVVGAPDHAAGEARLEGHRTRAVVAAERDAFEADARRVDVGAGLQPVDDAAGPVFAVEARGQAVQAQCLAAAGLVDQQRRDAAPRQPLRQADAVLHLLHRVQPVDLHQQRRRPGHALGAHVQRRQRRALVGDLDALAVVAGQRDAAFEQVEHAPVQRLAARRAMRLQALGRQAVGGRAAVLVAGRDQAAAGFVLLGQDAQLVGHAHPGLTEGARAFGVGRLGGLLQRGAHGLDLADAGTHLDREVDRQVPDVVGGEVAKHGRAA
jgi:hypothetical protein